MGIRKGLKEFISDMKDWYNARKTIDSLKGIIDENARLLRECQEARLVIYNKAVEEMGLVKTYRMEKFSGPQSRFWSGRYGIKSKRIIESYRQDKKWDEVIVSFESNADTYYWYFRILDEVKE